MTIFIGYFTDKTFTEWCASDRSVLSHEVGCRMAKAGDIFVGVNVTSHTIVLVARLAGACSDTPCNLYTGEDAKYNKHPVPIAGHRLVDIPLAEMAHTCGIDVRLGGPCNIYKISYYIAWARAFYHPPAPKLANAAELNAHKDYIATVLHRYEAFITGLLTGDVAPAAPAAPAVADHAAAAFAARIAELEARAAAAEARAAAAEARETRRRELPDLIRAKMAELDSLRAEAAALGL